MSNEKATSRHNARPDLLPVWFLAHGSPMLAIQDTPYTRTLAGLAGGLAGLSAVAVVSAHWQTRGGVRVTSSPRPETVHDFGGFDPSLHAISYPAPGAPGLAEEIVSTLARAGFEARPDPRRGLDHGAWVPLRWVFPGARVPVVQVSLPFAAGPGELLRLGGALAPLRASGVLLVGSGGIVHNLSTVRLDADEAPVPGWAREFDEWVRDRLSATDARSLAEYAARAPYASLAVPTPEHLEPLFVVLGAAGEHDRVATLYEGFQHGSLSLRSVALVPA